MIRIFMPLSGNLGDTLNVLPVLDAIYRKHGHAIHLILQPKMRMFEGIDRLLLGQNCISEVSFNTGVAMNFSEYNVLGLINNPEPHDNIPIETMRAKGFWEKRYKEVLDINEDFVLEVPYDDVYSETKILVGDRKFDPLSDKRRSSNILRDSGKFPIPKHYFIDYDCGVCYNASLIKHTKQVFHTTFTGVAVLADLLKKECIIYYDDEIERWQGKPITETFNQHFFRSRGCKLQKL